MTVMLAAGPAVADAYVVDFDAVMNSVADSHDIWNAVQSFGVLPEDFTLDPALCDLNGGFDISVTPIDLFPNGMLDSDEFALIAAILANPSFDCAATGGTSHTQVHNAWRKDFAQAWTDLGGKGVAGTEATNSTIMRMLPGIENFFTGAIVLGDQDTLAFPLLIVNVIKGNALVSSLLGGASMKTPNPDAYTLLYPYLAWCGDADGDGCSNYNEYQWAKSQGGTNLQIRARYIETALNPAVHPPDCTGDRICDGSGGLFGEYFSDDPNSTRKLTNLRATRIDHQVTFDWGSGTPHPALPANNFSVCWTGMVTPLYSEVYSFHVRTDDGVRLWVNDQLLVDEWNDHGSTTYTGNTPTALTAGQPYSIRMDFYENGGDAVAWLGWESASQPKKGIYEMYLKPGNGIGDRANDWIRNPATGHYYKLSPQPVSWTDGNTLAGQWGGYLTTINDAAENDWIRTMFGPVTGSMFTGANDIQLEGRWVWAENGDNFYNGKYGAGVPVDGYYSNWADQEPNNSGDSENAGTLVTSSGKWNDLNPATPLNCLVESDKDQINVVGPFLDDAISMSGNNALVEDGSTVILRVVVPHPYGNVYYQWRKDGQDISGAEAEEAAYTIFNASSANAGLYSCVVTDGSHAMQESGALQIGVLKLPAASVAALAGLALALGMLGARRRKS
jgi:hypothetical protein